MEGANLRNLHWLTDNADGLLWVPPGLDWHPIKFELHSLREGILTFAALAQYRNNAWAHQAGRKYLESIRRGLKPDFTWDFDQFDYARYFTGGENEDPGHKPSNEGRFALTVQHGRCIEALVWYYEATGDALAMELAEDLARFHLAYAIAPDGTIPRRTGAPGYRRPPIPPVHPVRPAALRLQDPPVRIRRCSGAHVPGRRPRTG